MLTPQDDRETSRQPPSDPLVVKYAGAAMAGNSQFRTTSWSLILTAANPNDAGQALTNLCQIYWKPVYAFIRRNGHDVDSAQDLTQEFFSRLIEKNYLEDADRRRGRFRSFLLTSVKHFLANEWDRTRALKRGGGHFFLSIDAVDADRSYPPGVVFDGGAVTGKLLGTRKTPAFIVLAPQALRRGNHSALQDRHSRGCFEWLRFLGSGARPVFPICV